MLVILLAPRPRADASDADTALVHVLSHDGLAVAQTGRCAPALMPKADSVVAVVPVGDIAWHRPVLPKAPPSRLRQALVGVLEEQLLDDAAEVHLALAPGARAGEPTWVAAVNRPWLTAQLATLAEAGLSVDRVVPAIVPGEAASGHFLGSADDADPGKDLRLCWSDADGVAVVSTQGSLARSMLPAWSARQPRWSAAPAVAAAAERWLGAPVIVRPDAELALAAARTSWNLRQFELTQRSRGLRALRQSGRQVWGPALRPARWGLLALAVVQLVGLNAWAWQQQRSLGAKRLAMTELLRSSHPQVRSILDAPVQMQRETELLRAASGRAGAEDFETLLALAAAAWPDGQPPVQQVRFEAGRLMIAAGPLAPEALKTLRTRVEAAGAQLTQTEGMLTFNRPARKASS